MRETVNYIINICEFIILIVGTIWAYFKIWKEGLYRPRIQFSLDCITFGSHTKDIPVQILININNRGLVKHIFTNITLRARGISKSNALTYWKDHEPRLEFPEKLFEAELIFKDKYKSIFVEPGIDQVLTYVTKVDDEIQYVLLRAEFNYDEFKTHSIEKLFELKR